MFIIYVQFLFIWSLKIKKVISINNCLGEFYCLVDRKNFLDILYIVYMVYVFFIGMWYLFCFRVNVQMLNY